MGEEQVNPKNIMYLEAVVDSHANGVIAVNREGIITIFNRTAEDMLGIKAKDVVGLILKDVIPNSFQLDTYMKMGKPQLNKHIRINKSSVMANISPITEDGEYQGAIAVIQNFTHIKALVEEFANTKDMLKTLETILENSYEGIVVVDKHAVVTMINKSYARFLGIKQEEAKGKHITEISENTKLPNTIETGRIEIGQIHYSGKNKMIVMRIPIFEGDNIVGAIEKILFKDIKELRALVQKLDKMEDELKYYKGELKRISGTRYNFSNIVAVSEKRKKMVELAQKAAKTNSTVLICGESGTGKELFAQAVHNASYRCYGSFIRVNCAAVPADLLESELFGYEKGAFTGALSEGKPGKFELANGGTIFLDEIGDMPLAMQSKLLRVLQEREIERVGGNYLIDLDIRVIAATNKNLEKMVERREFREDLYYRLNVVRIDIPPLRETKEDLKHLIERILSEFNDKNNLQIEGVSEEVFDCFNSYNWPGNVRELRNVLERAVNLCDGNIIELKDLPLSLKKRMDAGDTIKVAGCGTQAGRLDEIVRQAEIQAILAALKKTGGNKKKASELLGIHRSGLYQKLKAYNIK